MAIPIRTCIGCRKTDEVNKLYRWFCHQPENKTELISRIEISDLASLRQNLPSCDGFLWTKKCSQLNLLAGWYFMGKIKYDACSAASEIISLSNFDAALAEKVLSTLEFGIFSPLLRTQGRIIRGRGAWLHPHKICLQNAINHRAFQRSLKCDSTEWIDLTQFLPLMRDMS